MPPVFLDPWEVVRVHQDQIERYGGEPGVRDAASLASAVAMPQAGPSSQ
jgi:death on curing protein